jgi:hypothetical protein
MDKLSRALDFIKLVIATSISQLLWLLGLIFIFGLVLYIFARFTRITFVKSLGHRADIFFTGWIGVPVHELGHAIFCIIFRHKIIEIKLYAPNSNDGTIGYVNHSYNINSTYQKIGNFFIGIGPIIFGSIILYLMFYFLVPHLRELFFSIEAQSQKLIESVNGNHDGFFEAIWAATNTTLKSLFKWSNLSNYKFWIFLYLAVCVSSHMQLSPPDIKGATSGLVSILIFFLVVNTIILALEATGASSHFGSWWNYIKLENYTLIINKYLGMLGALFVFATIISGLNFIVSYLALSVLNLIMGKGFINPIW